MWGNILTHIGVHHTGSYGDVLSKIVLQHHHRGPWPLSQITNNFQAPFFH
jgi:hypothetical protein